MYNLLLKYFVYSEYFQRLQSWFQFAIKQSFSEADSIDSFTARKLAISLTLIMLFAGYKCSKSMVPCLNIIK